MIKYEVLKCVDEIKMFKNIDEFYKMHLDSMLDEFETDNVDDCFQLSCDLAYVYTSWETFKIELKHNNINNYIVIFDHENEYIYIYDEITNNIYDIHNDCIFTIEFKLNKIENINEKYNLMCLFFNVMSIK